MVAPALLSGCLKTAGINSYAVDLSIHFIAEFIDKPYWKDLKNILALGVFEQIPRRLLIDVFKFIKTQLCSIKEKYNPTHIGLSIFTNESINFSYLLIPYIRKYLPNTTLVLGGRGLELTCGTENKLHYKKYYDHGMADLIIVGDSETAIVDAIKSNATGIFFAKQQSKEDLIKIPLPDWSNYNFELYKKFDTYKIAEGHDSPNDDPRYIAVTASKGCVRHCTFCDVESFWPKYIYRDGRDVAEEIIFNYKNTGITNYRFTDNLINGSISHYRTLNLVLAENIPNTIKYRGYAIFRSRSQMPAGDFELARRAGCTSWTVGIESGSERVRYDMKKKFSNDDMDYGINQLYQNNIAQNLLLMVGYPTETQQDFEETKRFFKRYQSLNKNGMIRVGITPTFMMLNNSPLVQNSLLKNEYGIHFDHSDSMSRYFWTADVNDNNTFEVRYNRWAELVKLAQDLGYSFQPGMPVQKWADDLASIKKVYDERKSKKVFVIHPSA